MAWIERTERITACPAPRLLHAGACESPSHHLVGSQTLSDSETEPRELEFDLFKLLASMADLTQRIS